MAAVQYLPVACIHRRPDARPVDDGAVSSLVQSIGEVGQMTPILVRAVGERFEVIAGSHRLAAFERMGEESILAMFAEHDDDLHAELAMIDENLCRAELSASDRARQTARRKAIYEDLHPETKQGGAPGLAGGGKAKVDNLSGFADATADATGRDARSVRRDAERGAKVIDQVLDMVRGTKLDTGSYLDRIKDLPPNDQVQAAKRDLSLSRRADAAERTSRAQATPQAAPPSASTTTAAHERLIAALDMLDDLVVADVIAQCPPRERASLCQRASSAIDLLGNVMEGASA